MLTSLVGFAALADSLSKVGDMPSGGVLPRDRFRATALTDGQDIYIFGGNSGLYGWNPYSMEEITKFSPATNSFTKMSSKLSPPREGAAGIYDGHDFYLFGGYSTKVGVGALSQIVRYNPTTDTLTVLATVLPSPKAYASAVWTGQYVYIFGGGQPRYGYDSPGPGSADILRFDPATGSVVILSAKLPSARSSTAAAWEGGYAYIAGGYTASGMTNEILRFDPISGMATVVSRLPYGVSDAGWFWNGQDLVLVGGLTYEAGNTRSYSGKIFSFTPSTGRSSYMRATIDPRSGMFAAWVGSTAWLFGGQMLDCEGNSYGGCTVYAYYKSDYYRYTMEPGAPSGLLAIPTGSTVYLTWNPPAYDTFTTLDGYRIYRSEYGRKADGSIGRTSEVRIGEVNAYYGNYYYDPGCPTQKLCHYRVTAFNRFGEGPPSSYGYAVAIAGSPY